ncbi:acetyl-CoA hydrolase/transferase C-terminal domain-containing protein [Halalkalicoccus salilacus]|uniref:acetyl-CoA hydrolase/transferase C-terminal domain-containing protein n=1 Tax=Halalkalicoccus salilacus TaxID=3117459 RepID=UPI0038D4CD5D
MTDTPSGTGGVVSERLTSDLPVTDADAAADLVADDATVLVSGFGSVGYPKAVPLALAESGRDLELTVVSGGSVGEEIDVALVEAGGITRRYPFQTSKQAQTAANEGRIAFSDRSVGSLADEVQYGGLVDSDTAVVEAVAVGEDWFIPSTSIGQTPAFVDAAPELIVEVNRAQPLALQSVHDIYRPDAPPNREPIPLTDPGGQIGSPRITFDPTKLVAVVETDRSDTPYSFRDPTEADHAIATNLGEFLEQELDRSAVFDEQLHLQFGVGSLGNALMGELTDLNVGDREMIYFGEVIQDGLLDMLDSGRLESASATALALSAEGQIRLFDDIERYAEDIVLRPTDISNNPALIDRFGVVGVNSALEVDIYGNVNSTHVGGTRVLNGVGGSLDFNGNSLVAVCALPSTLKDGDISRIVPLTPHVDHTEHDIDVFVTEQGIADVRGCSPVERAERLIDECAHPDYRASLREYLDAAKERGGHIPHDFERALDWLN